MAVPSLFQNNSFSVHIGRGLMVTPHEFPFMANLRMVENNVHFCGGTIISAMLIITAAHCVENESEYENVRVVAGQHNLNIVDPKVEQKRKISKVYIHPNYVRGNKNNPPYDIAVIVLNTPFKFNNNVNCLNPLTTALNVSGKIGRIIGWGNVGIRETSPILNKAYIELMNRKKCDLLLNEIPQNVFLNIYESIICSTKSVKSICSGDSGGPMICKNNRGLASLCGVSVFSPDSCGEGFEIESYFTSLPYFYSWIKHGPMKDSYALGKNIYKNYSTLFCGNEEFLCRKDKTIPLIFQCDNENDCGRGEDEIGCLPCSENEFKCKNQNCITEDKVCNSQNDCSDGSDEFGCGEFCHPNFFLCASQHYCLIGAFVCDGNNDCHDGSDEVNCGNCKLNQFRCKNGNCIPLSHVCDYENDCKDGSDELNCENCKNEFRCKNDQCLKISSFCNGIKDCEDDSDEIDCSRFVLDFNNTTQLKFKHLQITTSTTEAPFFENNDDSFVHDNNMDFTSDEMELVNQLRDELTQIKNNENYDSHEYLQNWLNDNSNLVLLNFLKYNQHDLDKTEKHIKKAMKWRRENEIEKIFDWEYPHDFPERYPWRITGFTKDNKPVLYQSAGHWNTKTAVYKGQDKDFIRWVIFMCETAMKEASRRIDPKSGLGVGNIYHIVDLHQFNWALVNTYRSFLTRISNARIMDFIYPLSTVKVFIIRGPNSFYRAFERLKGFISEKSLERFIVADRYENNWKPPIYQRIPIEAIPVELGGKSN